MVYGVLVSLVTIVSNMELELGKQDKPRDSHFHSFIVNERECALIALFINGDIGALQVYL